MSLSPLNENGMLCSPHTPFPHCTKPHCVPPCTPHLASKLQITTTEGGRRWMRMNECAPSTPPLPPHLPRSHLPFVPSLTDCLPTCPSPLLHSAHPCFCRPVLWLLPVCITHISVCTTPLSGRPYKGLSFPKVRTESCTQVLSRHLVWKNKNGLLAHPCLVSVCLWWLWLPEASVSDVLSLFSSSSSCLSFASSTVVRKPRYPACVN